MNSLPPISEATKFTSYDIMHEELLFVQSYLQATISSLKQVYTNAVDCNPFVEDQAYDLLTQLNSCQSKINNLVYNVERTQVTFNSANKPE